MKLLVTAALLATLASAAWAEPNWAALGEQALQKMQAYIRIPSVNPPADSRPTIAFLKAWLEGEHVAAEIYGPSPDKQTLVARLPGRHHDAPLLLLHHMDVVPADASRWPVDPFAAVVRDGYLYGRGALDMKSLGILQVMTFLELKRQGVPLEQDLILMASPDEESGGERGAIWMSRNNWDKLHAAYVLDEGGFATPDLLSAAGKMTMAISVTEKKILWARITATGTAGHASQPTLDNPNDLLLKVLNLVQAAPELRENPVLRELRARVGTLADNKFTRAIQRDTLSVTSLRSGVGDPPKVNVIPSLAQATLDFRLLPDTDYAAVLKRLQDIVASVPGVTMEVLHSMDKAPVSSTTTPMFKAMEMAVRAQHPNVVVTPYLVPFGTDSNNLRLAGAQCYGFNPMLLDAAMVATMHSDAERIPVKEIAPGLRCYYEAVRLYLTSSSSLKP